MARTPPNPFSGIQVPTHLAAWAEALGEALGRGVARGLNSALTSAAITPSGTPARRGPGRPPKTKLSGSGAVPAERRCKTEGCQNPARSKGLCSKHYQAERRKQLSK